MPAGRKTNRTAVTTSQIKYSGKVICYLSVLILYFVIITWHHLSEGCRYEPRGGARVSDTTHLRSAQPSAEEQTPHWSCQWGLAQPLHRKRVSDILTSGLSCNMVIWMWNCCCKTHPVFGQLVVQIWNLYIWVTSDALANTQNWP